MREIQLTRGMVAIVDDEDYEELSRHKWQARKGLRTWYAEGHEKQVNGRRQQLSMHRMIMKASKGFQVDHIDGDGLNNTRGNLRLCTRQENQFNRLASRGTSKYKGVYKCKRSEKWIAEIRINGKTKQLGRFSSEEDAARAYDDTARPHHGKYARLNFPQQDEQSALVIDMGMES